MKLRTFSKPFMLPKAFKKLAMRPLVFIFSLAANVFSPYVENTSEGYFWKNLRLR